MAEQAAKLRASERGRDCDSNVGLGLMRILGLGDGNDHSKRYLGGYRSQEDEGYKYHAGEGLLDVKEVMPL